MGEFLRGLKSHAPAVTQKSMVCSTQKAARSCLQLVKPRANAVLISFGFIVVCGRKHVLRRRSPNPNRRTPSRRNFSPLLFFT